jgi:hypothetical protein
VTPSRPRDSRPSQAARTPGRRSCPTISGGFAADIYNETTSPGSRHFCQAAVVGHCRAKTASTLGTRRLLGSTALFLQFSACGGRPRTSRTFRNTKRTPPVGGITSGRVSQVASRGSFAHNIVPRGNWISAFSGPPQSCPT